MDVQLRRMLAFARRTESVLHRTVTSRSRPLCTRTTNDVTSPEWQAAGLGARPTPLTGKAGPRKLMRRVLEEIVEQRRLEWLGMYLRRYLVGDEPVTWDALIAITRASLPEEFGRAVARAELDVAHDDSVAPSHAASCIFSFGTY